MPPVAGEFGAARLSPPCRDDRFVAYISAALPAIESETRGVGLRRWRGDRQDVIVKRKYLQPVGYWQSLVRSSHVRALTPSWSNGNERISSLHFLAYLVLLGNRIPVVHVVLMFIDTSN